MQTQGFSETQLTVREAIFKICSNFPDVGTSLDKIPYIAYHVRGILDGA